MLSTVLQRLERCSTLPTLPGLALRVLDLCQREEVNLSEISKVLTTDPALATKVLRMANSPAMALRTPAKTVSHAVSLLGANAVRTLALSFSLASEMRRKERKEAQNLYWKRSILSAMAAQELARATSFPHPEEAFLAGLLQDIGVLALRQAVPEYAKLLKDAGVDHVKLAELECAALGGDHAEVGGWLLGRWNLPGVLSRVVAASHDGKAEGVDPAFQPLINIVTLSGWLADIWVQKDAATATRFANAQAAAIFGMNENQLEPVLRALASEMLGELAQMLEAEAGSPKEVNAILEQAKETLMMMALRAEQHAEQVRMSATKLEEQHRALSEESRKDKLTRLYNRECFDSYLREQFEASRLTQKPISLLFCDVDHFKRVNDTYGHAAGDEVLVTVAKVLSERLRQKDLPVRYGGEEFVLVLPETDRQGASAVGERLRRRTEETTVTFGESSLRVTISIGAATFTGSEYPSGSALVQAADAALYEAKRGGRNRVAVANQTPAAEKASSSSSASALTGHAGAHAR